MKKSYTKPILFAETFELLEHIATCAVAPGETEVTYRDRYSCSFKDGEVTIFNDGVTGCVNDYAPFFTDPDDFLASLNPEEGHGCWGPFSNGQVFAS